MDLGSTMNVGEIAGVNSQPVRWDKGKKIAEPGDPLIDIARGLSPRWLWILSHLMILSRTISFCFLHLMPTSL